MARTCEANSTFRVFIFSPGTSMVMIAMLSRRTLRVNADAISIIPPPEPLLRQAHPQHRRSLNQIHRRDGEVHAMSG